MAVTTDNSSNQYTATSGQTVFPYAFEIFDKDDIAVDKNGVILAEGTDYTVSNVGVEAGGNVTLLTGATSGDTITLYRDMELVRLNDYQQSGDFLANEVNSDYDRLWLALQQVYGDSRLAIRGSQNDTVLNRANTILPSPANRADRFLSFDANGAPQYLPTPNTNDVSDLDYISAFNNGFVPGATGLTNATILKNLIETAEGKRIYINAGNYSLQGFTATADQANIVIDKNATITGVDNGVNTTLIRLDGKELTVTGGIIDCNELYATGVMVYNDTATEEGNNVFSDLTIKNVLQDTAKTTQQANGITVWGGFASSVVDNCTIDNIKSNGADTEANGAIARGIVFRYFADTDLVSIRNAVLNTKISDLAPAGEADGIFAQETPFLYRKQTKLYVNNCTFINCEKRAVKSQVSLFTATNNVVYRTRPPTLSDLSSTSIFGTEFDAQYGNGFISNNKAYYTSGNNAPTSFAVASSKMTLERDGSISTATRIEQPTIVTNNFVQCDDDVSLYNASFVITQNRIASDESFYNNIENLIIENNNVERVLKYFIFSFHVGTSAEPQIKQIVANDNRVRECDAFMLVTKDSSNTPVANNFFGGEVYVTNFESANNGVVPLLNKSGFTTDNYKFTAQHASGTKFTGGVDRDTVTGEALNTDVIEFDIIRPDNSTFKVKANFNRPTNSANDRVQAISEFYLNDQELSGRRTIKKIYEENTPQAGEWEIVGDINRIEPTNSALRRTTIRKTAGTTTDAFGASVGQYRIDVEGVDIAIVAKDSTTGITPTSEVITQPTANPVFCSGGFVPAASAVTSQFGDGGTVTYISAGVYRVTLDIAQADANYSVLVSCEQVANTDRRPEYTNKLAASFDVVVVNANGQRASTNLPTEISFTALR